MPLPTISSPDSSEEQKNKDISDEAQPVFGHHSQKSEGNKKLFRSSKNSFSSKKAKYFLGGLALSLLMIAGGVAYHLNQQTGVGDIRQQASEDEFPLYEDFGTNIPIEGWRVTSSNSGWGGSWGENDGKYTLDANVQYEGSPSLFLMGNHLGGDVSRYGLAQRYFFEKNKEYVILAPVYIPAQGNDFSTHAKPEILVECHSTNPDGSYKQKEEQPVDFNKMPINLEYRDDWQVVSTSFKQTKINSSNEGWCVVVLSVWNNHKSYFGPVEIYEDTGAVTNGSFENDLDGWEIATDADIPATIEKQNEEIKPNHGSKMLKLAENRQLTDNPIGFVAVSQSVKIPQDSNSLLFFRYVIYSEDTSVEDSFDRFELWFNDSDLKFKDGNQVNEGLGVDIWRRVPGIENPRNGQISGWGFKYLEIGEFADQEIEVSFRNYWRYDNWYSTYTYIDDVRVVQLLKTLTYTSSFPSGWNFSVSDPAWNDYGGNWIKDEGIGTVQTVRAKSGNALRLTSKNPSFDSNDSLVQLCKTVNLQPGRYMLSASANLFSTAGANRFSRPGILIQQEGGNYEIYYDIKDKFNYEINKWQDISGEFAITSNQTSNRICLQALNNADVVFDDIKIKQINIPLTWTFNVSVICPDGSQYTGDSMQAFYALWPPNPLEWSISSLSNGQGSISITSSNDNNSGYLGIEFIEAEGDDGVALVLAGDSPHTEILYGTWFNPLTPMIKFSRNLPEGTYNISYQATEDMCITSPPPTVVPPTGECTTDSDCSNGQVCHPNDQMCVTPACTDENVEEVCPDLPESDPRSPECVLKTCDYPGTYRAACTFVNSSNIPCADGDGVCSGGACAIETDVETSLSLIISPDGVPYTEGEVRHHPKDHGQEIAVQVSLINTKDTLESKKVTFIYDKEIGAYQTKEAISYSNLRPGPYIIGLKGPMHLAKPYCFIGGNTQLCTFEQLIAETSKYQADLPLNPQFIVLESGEETINLSKRPLPVGDLPISGARKNSQDGKVNVFDYSYMLSCIGEKSRTDVCISRADVDFSGQVNNIDLGLLRKTLSEVADQF
ncbi:MAG: hypothetical protein XD95_0596 [Microgenomates bacterium 39_7]|nr:MAG: hypothetical protein XD95_0596 [Microgenomates bacterium 39_7]